MKGFFCGWLYVEFLTLNKIEIKEIWQKVSIGYICPFSKLKKGLGYNCSVAEEEKSEIKLGLTFMALCINFK